MSMNRYEEGWAKAQEARRSAESLGNQQFLSELMTNAYPDYYNHQGDLEAARNSIHEGVALCDP